MELRGNLLALDPADLGLEAAPLWAALMEWGTGGGVTSLVVVADGTTSLYLSVGGGVIGAGQYERVARMSAVFLGVIEQNLSLLEPVPEVPLPQAGEVRFHALTAGGPRTAGAAERALGHPHRLSPMFAAGNDVLAELRLIGDKMAPHPPEPP